MPVLLSRRLSWRALFMFLLCVSGLRAAAAEEVVVAVASNFSAPVEALNQSFQKQSGHRLKISTGASGKFYAQIQNGAPFQVFLSADEDKPTQLEREGLAVAGSRFTYAIGKLVLWSADPTMVDSQGLVLFRDHFNKLALANPKTAPYGEAAVEVLGALNLKTRLEPKWVMGENISQTYQFVATGNADIGFVALSQVMKDQKLTSGSAWIVPAKLYSPIKQDAVLLLPGKDSVAARQFLAFLKSPEALRIIQSYGYVINR
jgi:molybdate transport system substrate-binding protein